MSKITSQIKYDRTTIMYAASRTLERSAYYGMRSIMLIYLVNGAFSVSETDAMVVYNFFINGIVAGGIVGAIFGDFILGNRKTLLLGTVIMTLGFFLLCIPVKEVFYSGIALVAIGSGFYTPNLMARFGKQFYTQPGLTDGGFSILYVLVNIGAFLGIFIIGVVALNNYTLGFGLSGLLMVGSAILSFINKDNISDERQDVSSNSWYGSLIILSTILGLGLFWYVYDLAYNDLYDMQMKIMDFNSNINPMIWQNLSTGLCVVAGVVFAVIYSFYYFGRAFKLAFGLIVSAAALGTALLIPVPIAQNSIVLMAIVVLLMSIAEMAMAPVLYGLIVQRTNPKYLATIISLSFAPVTVLKVTLLKHFIESIPSDNISLKIAAPLFLFMGATAFVFWLIKKLMKPK